jgi:hypothetical protein
MFCVLTSGGGLTRNAADRLDGLDYLPLPPIEALHGRGHPKLSVARLAQWCTIAVGTLAGQR